MLVNHFPSWKTKFTSGNVLIQFSLTTFRILRIAYLMYLGISVSGNIGERSSYIKSLMKLLTLKLLPKEEATNRPIFFGGKVFSQGFVDSNNSDFFNMAVVSFEKGARNKFHVHSSDQILYVTSGRGIVATEEQEYVVSSGTTIHIPAGERHWHGATNDGAFAHITVTPVGSTTEIREL